MKKIAIGITSLTGIFAAASAFAQDIGSIVNSGLNYGTIVGWGTQDLRTVIMRIISVIMGFLGIIAIIIVLVGGFKWMTAGGNEDKVSEARRLIISGIIGLAIVIGAWSIAAFVVQQLAVATS